MPNRASVDFELADESEALRRSVPENDAQAERALWFAVIEQAVQDARGGTTAVKDGTRLLNQAEARVWLKSKLRCVGSLLWILDVTGIDTTQAAILKAIPMYTGRE